MGRQKDLETAMLEVQKYLQYKTLEDLVDEFGIRLTYNSDGRVILNYHMIDSHSNKYHPIVLECRGLVLDSNNSYALVARSFPRFFNLGEDVKSQKKFCWEGSNATDKEDGSLLIIYYWDHDWRINTRGSFGEGVVNNGVITWYELAEVALPDNWRNNFDKHYTYVCELCSLHNKIVREYKTPQIFLLTTFQGEIEHTVVATDNIGNEIGLDMPDYYKFHDAYDAVAHISKMVESDITYEGVVIRDKNNRRLKAKSPEYVRLHGMASNGYIGHPKNLINFIMEGDTAEVISLFPEVKDKIAVMELEIEAAWKEIEQLWFCYNDLKSRKKFALAIKHSRYSGVLFAARNHGVHPREIWDADTVLKLVFDSKPIKKRNYDV